MVLLILFLTASAAFYLYSTELFFPKEQRTLIIKQAKKYNLDPLLISAIIYTESRFKQTAQSNRGALGLMQLMPSTASEIARKMKISGYSKQLLLNPDLNVSFGCFYLAELKKKFNHHNRSALIAYNAGKTNLDRWLKAHQKENSEADILQYAFPETKNYVADIEKIYEFLKLSNSVLRNFNLPLVSLYWLYL